MRVSWLSRYTIVLWRSLAKVGILRFNPCVDLFPPLTPQGNGNGLDKSLELKPESCCGNLIPKSPMHVIETSRNAHESSRESPSGSAFYQSGPRFLRHSQGSSFSPRILECFSTIPDSPEDPPHVLFWINYPVLPLSSSPSVDDISFLGPILLPAGIGHVSELLPKGKCCWVYRPIYPPLVHVSPELKITRRGLDDIPVNRSST